ncbi:MAG TPA: CRISPR-associated protein Csx19 [Anaerolineaceae bacterium]|nr:CRISPR-associated protein Csx19 [Anaerolineaceae bacterium]
MSRSYGKPVEIDARSFADDPRTWLAQQMTEDMPWLLAHAYDGVIWGKRQRDGTLLLSGDVFPNADIAVALRVETLQQARVFGEAGELLVWRTEAGFVGRLIEDSTIGLEKLPDESHLLWHQGSPVKVDSTAGFALLQEGAQGQRHAPPVIPSGRRRPALKVRHYVDYDDEGQAFIALSRLVGLEE